MSTAIIVKSVDSKAVTTAIISFTMSVIDKLAGKYGFDKEEAAEFININSISVKVGKSKRVVPSFLLPWCGKICSDNCQAIKKNRGLMTQCSALPKAGSTFCGPCEKSIDPQIGTPPLGIIADRLAPDWTDPNGKKPVKFAKVMASIKIGDVPVTIEQVKEEAAKFDMVIAESEFVLDKPVRKMKKEKDVSSSDDDSGSGSDKKRGRPKKVKPMSSGASSSGDDLIASLLDEAKHKKQPDPVPNVVVEPEPVKEAEPKKEKEKKVTKKEAEPKKEKKVTKKEAAPKEATPKEATPKEATPKEATPKEATPKEATPKEATPKKEKEDL
ncbi:MAG: hypothetical protein P8J32_03575, partial [bacterium]|nr:hypothetical protein [bacterium]